VVLTDPDGVRRPPVRMRDTGTDVSRMEARVTPDREGTWTFAIESWSDPLATWLHDAGLKIRAELVVTLAEDQCGHREGLADGCLGGVAAVLHHRCHIEDWDATDHARHPSESGPITQTTGRGAIPAHVAGIPVPVPGPP
jgi:hypothetical protein